MYPIGVIIWGTLEKVNGDNPMANKNPQNIATERLNELLAQLAEKGVNQSAVARRAGMPVAFLSDLKRGQRQMTELIARRLGEEFNVDYGWLLGLTADSERPVFRSKAGGERTLVPLLDVPVAGDPRAHKRWKGAYVELVGIAAVKAAQSAQPYVLRFGNNDHAGRLKKGDHILVSQSASDSAELSVVVDGSKLFLARRQSGNWIRAATGQPIRGEGSVAGHCVGVIWAPL
jgi:hypothetical protein